MPKRTSEEILMEKVFDNKELMSDHLYYTCCVFAKLAYELRELSKMDLENYIDAHRRGLQVAIEDHDGVKVLTSIPQIRKRGLMRLEGLDEHAAELMKLTEKEKVLLLGHPSTHGGSANANTTDMIYGARSLRSGRLMHAYPLSRPTMVSHIHDKFRIIMNDSM